ncbi:hypothetical protein [Fusobacterium gonidiaformans]|uniref:hypothetical protein n=1 Tax=Fusobacterium gonidiaformans TaxID=849 RepID=UPI0023F2317F|nr:hypothetical protein [Fusobacterium gonidiaformans]
MKKYIIFLQYFLLGFFLYADSYYKEEGVLEDGTRYTKESWTSTKSEKTKEKKVEVVKGKKEEIREVDLKFTEDFLKRERENQKKEKENYQNLWKNATKQENNLSESDLEDSVEYFDDFEVGEIEE